MRGGFGLLLPALLAPACGGGGGGADAPPADAPPRCDPTQPFGAPVLVGGINSNDADAAARLRDDELEITFSRLNNGVWDLWRATRPTADDPFGTPTLLTTVNSVSSELWPTISPDGLTLLFDADRTAPNAFHIWRSTRPAVTSPFGPPQLRPELMDGDFHPFLANATALYFTSTVRAGLGGAEIFRAPLDEATGMIGTPVALVGGINTPDAEEAPTVTPDERTIFFRRVSTMESDIFTASRSTAADGFGTSGPVPGLNVPGVDEVPNWVSPDECRLYFHSDVDTAGGPASANIWMAARPPAT